MLRTNRERERGVLSPLCIVGAITLQLVNQPVLVLFVFHSLFLIWLCCFWLRVLVSKLGEHTHSQCAYLFGANRQCTSRRICCDQTRVRASKSSEAGCTQFPKRRSISRRQNFTAGANWITSEFNWPDENHKTNVMKNCWVFYWHVAGPCK
jgi:hypothetical protein